MDNSKGLYQKYIIQKADGTPIDEEAEYFVLRLDKDPVARVAVMKYAEEIKKDNPQLWRDIFVRVNSYEGGFFSQKDTR